MGCSMAYFKIGNTDFSHLVRSMNVTKEHNYNAQTNAAGNTVVDYINAKRTIDVGFIYMSDSDMSELQAAVDSFAVTVTYRDPKTNALETANCIAPKIEADYYTIQADMVLYNEFTVEFTE